MGNFYTNNQQRVITGLMLIGGFAIVAMIDNAFLTWLILGVTYMFSFYEAMRLFKVEGNYLYAIALFLWVLAYFYPSPDDLIFLVLIFFASIISYNRSLEFKILYPFLYPTISFLFLLELSNEGMSLLIWLIAIVALTDTGAYFVGKSIGQTQFSPTSPKKTMEGVVGGVLIATVIGAFVGYINVEFLTAFIISFAVSVTSIFGDLFESFLKREAGVKDSGDVLPGHGGVLDRMDGYMFAGIILVILFRSFA